MKKLLAAFSLAAIAAFTAIQPASATHSVTVKAHDFAFSPAVVTLKEGQPTAITFVSTQGVHGLTVPAIGLNKTVTITSSPTTVTVTPHKIGTFVSHCAIYCGIGHEKMHMVFKVVK